MAVQILKPLKVKWIGDEKFTPKNIIKTEFYFVIGINSYNYNKIDDGITKTQTIIKFLVINDISKITQMAVQNCQVLIDENEKK